MLNPTQLKADFPILNRQINGKPLVYLDSAATSQKPRQVIQAITNYYENHNANVHRGVHQLGDESTKLFHQSRHEIAQFFGADSSELVIVRNETEAANLWAYSWGAQHLQADDTILLTEMDHHSNIVPWQILAERKKAQITFVSITDDGLLDLESLSKALQTNHVSLVAFSHVSNTLGTLNPVEEIVSLVKKHHPKACIFVDGAQAAPHLSIDFHQLNVDAYAVSAHKMLGPMGIGGLLVKKDLLQTLPPFLYGGGMIDEVTTHGTTFIVDLEERFTAGTPDVAGLVGWAAACEYLKNVGMAQALQHDQLLVAKTFEVLDQFPQIHIIGSRDVSKRVGSVAFVYEGVHAHDVGQVLDSEGVAVRSGHHCTMPLHLKLGLAASTRASFHIYTSLEDIEIFGKALKKVAQVFGK
jgi:cysteine desulfurase / selenocysteine lyase